MKIEYMMPDDGGEYPFDAFELSGKVAGSPNYLALVQECAENYDSEHGGWEASWPLMIDLYIDGKNVGTFEVYKEALPNFSAHQRKDLLKCCRHPEVGINGRQYHYPGCEAKP